jgi:hypothetical protein
MMGVCSMGQDAAIAIDEGVLDVAKDVEREAEAALSLKMSSKVRVQRWPSPGGPVIGPALIILDLGYVAEALAISGFMKPWIVEQIKAHLKSGGEFINRGLVPRDNEEALVPNGESIAVQVKSEYRMATEQEVLDYVDTAQFANITGHKVSARAQERGFLLHYHEGAELIAAYDKLPRQAKVVLDLLNDTGRENFTEASIEVILTENQDELKTKQDPMKIFAFYRHRLMEEGHLEEVE